jgi:uncharacterized protein (TIGR02996 family)
VDDAPFLHAVLDHPDDDGPRLVYADWLFEQGGDERHARAEFITLQCRLAGRVRPNSDRPAMLKRERELLARYGDAWAGSVRDIAPAYRFRRGFVEAVDLDIVTFVLRGDELFRTAPVRELRLHGSVQQDILGLAACLDLTRLRALDLSRTDLSPDGLGALLASEFTTGLRELNLGMNPARGDGFARALAASPVLAQLTRLDLTRTNLGPDGLTALLRLPVSERFGARNLRDLRLRGNALPTTRSPRPVAPFHDPYERLLAMSGAPADPAWERHWRRLLGLNPGPQRPHPDIAGAVRDLYWQRRWQGRFDFWRDDRLHTDLPCPPAFVAWMDRFVKSGRGAGTDLNVALADSALPPPVADKFVALCGRRARWWAQWWVGYAAADEVSALAELPPDTNGRSAARTLLELADRTARRRPRKSKDWSEKRAWGVPVDRFGQYYPSRETEAAYLLGWLAQFVFDHHRLPDDPDGE